MDAATDQGRVAAGRVSLSAGDDAGSMFKLASPLAASRLSMRMRRQILRRRADILRLCIRQSCREQNSRQNQASQYHAEIPLLRVKISQSESTNEITTVRMS
jgi:hypothetical protein